ncbi:hypothetical protein CSA37_03425 [Candidatus Fermentibacteria bacterium]|nr:MAG: hypothetical protein CSA37_03425 [Candidatus Fermentibacteria bacterium]
MLMFDTVLTALVIVSSSVIEADTPELFLHGLADATAEEWVESAAFEGNDMHPDSIRITIEGFRDLSVEPGERVLEDFDGGYRAIFTESRWIWRLDQGRIGSVTGETVVEWRPGGYRWVTAPVFSKQSSTVGPRERMCVGVTAMGAVVMVSFIALWYAKRRYGS